MKIAIVKLSALGDIVHAMVVLEFVKNFNKDIIIDWIVEESYKDLLTFNPNINKVHIINIKNAKKNKSIYSLFIELFKVKNFGPYDLVIDMQGLIKSALIARFIPSKVTLGFDKNSSREYISSIFYNKIFISDYCNNIVERNFELMKFALNLTSQIKEINNKLPFLHSIEKYTFPLNSLNKKNVILIPGASHSSKQYPANKFAQLSLMFDANFLVIWGNKEEKILADEIKVLSPEVNVCDKLSIGLLISLIKQADLVIGADTGPTHIAWALNRPSITLFGPTPGYRNSYVTKINRILESTSIVNPLKIDKNDISIKDIDIQEILEEAKKLLK